MSRSISGVSYGSALWLSSGPVWLSSGAVWLSSGPLLVEFGGSFVKTA